MLMKLQNNKKKIWINECIKREFSRLFRNTNESGHNFSSSLS